MSAALLAIVAVFAAAPVEVKQTVAPEKVLLGEPFTRTLELTHASEERGELRPPTGDGAFELLEVQRRRTDGPRTATTTYTVRLSAFELGELTLPPLTFEVATQDGESQWTSPEAKVTVASSLPPDAEEKGAGFYDIRPPQAVPVPSYALLWFLGGLLVAALLAYLLYRWWKRPRPPAALKPATPALPLAVRTRNALDALAAERLPEQGRSKEFYVRLADIARGYLGERYRVEALECTTSELMERLGPVRDEALPKEALSQFLFAADLVKFAKAERTSQDAQASLQFAYHLLAVTTPAATPNPSDPKPPSDAPQR